MIDKSQYKIFKNYIKYEPVAGLTIIQALKDGLDIFNTEKLPVNVNINDIIINIHKNVDVRELASQYYMLLEHRNYMNIIKNKNR